MYAVPDVDEVVAVAKDLGIHLGPDEAVKYQKYLIEQLDQLDSFVQARLEEADPPMVSAAREPGHRPSPEEDPLNAWIWKCRIEGSDDGLLAGKTVSYKDHVAVAGIPMSFGSFALEGFTGAAVALDPQSGEVLALASLPAYNPNDFALGIDSDTWSKLNGDTLKPLQNRALQGRYSPGSTFKLVMAAAALEEGFVTEDFEVKCRGGGTFYGRFFRCHTPHGTVAMDEALEKSCNTYFYTLGGMIDVDIINRWATLLGLGELSGIDLPHEVQGIVPSRVWKRERMGEPWYPGETISVSIGQGAVSVTPISLAVMMSAVANGGMRIVPHLLKATRTDGEWITAGSPKPTSVGLKPETVETINRGLWMAVNRQGTGARGRLPQWDVIGKTGTAQVISLEGRESAKGSGEDFRDHGWFVFAAPRENPKIAGVVFAEHSKHGYLAAPIAKHIMETFFAKQEGLSLPMLPVSPPPVLSAVVTGG